METIVLGLDGTESSVMAVDWVAQRAALRPAHVEIVLIGEALFQDDVRRDAQLIDAVRRLRAQAPGTEISPRRPSGMILDSLLQHAHAADLLVVGSQRGQPTWSALIDGMRPHVASRVTTPIVVVPDDWRAIEGSVVVGVDGDSSIAAVDLASREASVSRLPLVLVHAWRMPVPRLKGSVTLLASPLESRSAHRRALRETAMRVRSAYPEAVIVQLLEEGSPAPALLAAAKTASLVVIGTRHAGFIADALLSSVGEELLSRSRVPVCVVPGIVADGHVAADRAGAKLGRTGGGHAR